MLKTKKRNAVIMSNVLAVILFLLVSYFMLPQRTNGIGMFYFVILEFTLLLFSLIIGNTFANSLSKRFEYNTLKKTETVYVQDFIDALRF